MYRSRLTTRIGGTIAHDLRRSRPILLLQGHSISTNPSPVEDQDYDQNLGQPQGKQKNEQQENTKRRRRIPILQYHDDWVCVNKPAQMTVHRSRNTPNHEPVLTSTLKRQLSRKVFPVHRLDHRTSGAMLLAFDSKTAGRLHDNAIRNGRKTYLALLRGSWRVGRIMTTSSTTTGTTTETNTNSPIILNQSPHVNNQTIATITVLNERSCVVDKPLLVGGDDVDVEVLKEARTKFTLLAETTANATISVNESGTTDSTENSELSCCLVLCEPLQSGRTHQIRRHAFALGQPILGDSRHGDSRANRWWRKHYGLNRLALHCWMIEFVNTMAEDDDDDDDIMDHDGQEETTGQQQTVTCLAPIPTELRDVLEGNLPSLWDHALIAEPRLATKPYDERGGSYGRKYREVGEKT